MTKIDGELPERLGLAGATELERRLLSAASNEQPTRELSERMARGIGVALPAVGAGSATGLSAKSATAASKAAGSSSALLPWISGALVAALVAGGFVASRHAATPTPGAPSRSAPVTSPALPAVSGPALPGAVTPTLDNSPSAPPDEVAPRAPAVATPQRSREPAAGTDLAHQVALVDAARAALASGAPQRALSSVREYQTTYPRGAFQPEVAAIRIEALLKLGKKTEARALAERFPATYGSGLLAERVARMAGATPP